MASTLLAFEVTASLRRLVDLPAITPAAGEAALAHFPRLPVRRAPRKERLFPVAYLALAPLYQGACWTAAAKLSHAGGAVLSWVPWIGPSAADRHRKSSGWRRKAARG